MIAPTPTSPSESPIVSNTRSDRWIVETLLAEQQQLTAVDRFSQHHAVDKPAWSATRYRDLIPLSAPEPGEQYAFDVDLDACSGCKACVTACHRLNGLETEEVWRSVGMLYGGSTNEPVLQHVTTACHHCLDPACLNGCPVEAYEKDPLTGIVRHLDDQCIGCKYCMFMCPYDVPKYSHSKGIVRKCDMCHDRLTAGEAPACVQSCPNGAIRITKVSKASLLEASEASAFLPGAPEPSITVPATTYRTNRVFPRNTLPADYFSARPDQAHWPLIVMLILTQMSVGAFIVDQLLPATGEVSRLVNVVAAVGLGLLGMGAALFHLGRPLYAFRAVVGLRHSWLSREILAFSVFALFASLYAAAALVEQTGSVLPNRVSTVLGRTAATVGVVAVFTSVMIYVKTRRPFWSPSFTATRFFGTAVVLGLPMGLLIALVGAALSGPDAAGAVMATWGRTLCRALVLATAVKLALESVIFAALLQRTYTPLKRTAYLLTNELGLTTFQRYFFGVAGGMIVPLLMLSQSAGGDGSLHWAFITALAATSLVTLSIGELLERYLFFSAVVAPKMPGVPAT